MKTTRANRLRRRGQGHHGPEQAGSGTRGFACEARAVGKTGRPRAVRRRHRARDEQSAPGHHGTPRAADRSLRAGAAGTARAAADLPGSGPHQPHRAEPSRLQRVASHDAAEATRRSRDQARHRQPAGGAGASRDRSGAAHERGAADDQRRSVAAPAGLPEHPDQRGARDRIVRIARTDRDHDYEHRRTVRSSRQSATQDRAFRQRSCRASSIRSSRRKMSAKAPASDWLSPTASSRSTVAGFRSPMLLEAGPSSRSRCRLGQGDGRWRDRQLRELQSLIVNAYEVM